MAKDPAAAIVMARAVSLAAANQGTRMAKAVAATRVIGIVKNTNMVNLTARAIVRNTTRHPTTGLIAIRHSSNSAAPQIKNPLTSQERGLKIA